MLAARMPANPAAFLVGMCMLMYMMVVHHILVNITAARAATDIDRQLLRNWRDAIAWFLLPAAIMTWSFWPPPSTAEELVYVFMVCTLVCAVRLFKVRVPGSPLLLSLRAAGCCMSRSLLVWTLSTGVFAPQEFGGFVVFWTAAIAFSSHYNQLSRGYVHRGIVMDQLAWCETPCASRSMLA